MGKYHFLTLTNVLASNSSYVLNDWVGIRDFVGKDKTMSG